MVCFWKVFPYMALTSKRFMIYLWEELSGYGKIKIYRTSLIEKEDLVYNENLYRIEWIRQIEYERKCFLLTEVKRFFFQPVKSGGKCLSRCYSELMPRQCKFIPVSTSLLTSSLNSRPSEKKKTLQVDRKIRLRKPILKSAMAPCIIQEHSRLRQCHLKLLNKSSTISSGLKHLR